MLYLKIAFWVALVLFLLPANNQEKLEVYGTAYRSMTDVDRFCYRNPEICAKTSAIVDTVRAKFRTTAEMIEEMLHSAGFGGAPAMDDEAFPPSSQRQGGSYDASRGKATSSVAHRGSRGRSQHTLTRDDLEPAWNGPGRMAYDNRMR